MRFLVSGSEMEQYDKNTSKFFKIPPLLLMEQAAIAFVEQAQISKESRILVVCGRGNNGGDGIAIARHLCQRGYDAALYIVEPDQVGTAEFELQKQIYKGYGFLDVSDEVLEADYDVIVDALFGTGLSRPVEGVYEQVISEINEADSYVISVDIASGVCADTGQILGAAVRADETITFSFEKIGHYLFPGAACAGKVKVAEIGIIEKSWLNNPPCGHILEEKDIYTLLPKRRSNTHKGSYGKLLVIAGSVNMAGASILCARAAYKMGAGLVKLYVPEENRVIVQTTVPEAIVETYTDTHEEERVKKMLAWADAVVMGPGIGTKEETKQLLDLVVSECKVPLILDADALNILAQQPELLEKMPQGTIFTPHLMEMARLCDCDIDEIRGDLVSVAKTFSEYCHGICVLKEAHTIIALSGDKFYLNLSGNHGMATAGSGDVLSGVIAGLLAQGAKPEEAAPLGVYLHGLAGDFVRKKTGTYGMTASDLMDGLNIIWNQVEENEHK